MDRPKLGGLGLRITNDSYMFEKFMAVLPRCERKGPPKRGSVYASTRFTMSPMTAAVASDLDSDEEEAIMTAPAMVGTVPRCTPSEVVEEGDDEGAGDGG